MRISGVEMEKALINANIFISTDIETSGFSIDKGAEIIEIGASMINCDSKKIIKTFNKLIKPRNGRVSKKITDINNITNEMLNDAPYIEPVLCEFSSFICNYPLVFHNASFDWDRFLDPLLRRQGIFADNQIIDTLPLTKVCLPDLKTKKLEAICNHFGYNLINAHRAISDAKATGSIAVKYREILTKHHGDVNTINLTNKNNKQVFPDLKIKSINCWDKAKKRRIYILTNWGNLFYDLNKKNWFVANTNYEINIDFNVVQNEFFRICNLFTVENIDDYFEAKIKEKEKVS